jgi:hypothetical protein
MQKIKAIQKFEDIYYSVVPNSPASNQVDKIEKVLVDKELISDEFWNIKGCNQQYEYHGFKDGKLVFTMTNDNLTIWYE